MEIKSCKINDTCGAPRVNLITVRVLQVLFFCIKKGESIMENSNYLGTERVGKLLRQFAIPCICSLIISCLYNIVDQIFVGNGVGYLGNAATGVVFPITVVGWGLSLFLATARLPH